MFFEKKLLPRKYFYMLKHRLGIYSKAVLSLAQMLPSVSYIKFRSHPEELMKKLQEQTLEDLSIDATERRINRPKNYEEKINIVAKKSSYYKKHINCWK